MDAPLPPPPLPYATPSRPKSPHETVFIALLIVLAVLCILVIGQFIIMHKTGMLARDSSFVFYIIFTQSLFLVAIVAGLVLGALFLSVRRIITIALSVVPLQW